MARGYSTHTVALAHCPRVSSAAMVAAPGPSGRHGGIDGVCARGKAKKTEAPAERQKIIVEFAVPEGPEGTAGAPADPVAAIRKVADAILARLDAPVRESAKLFENLPLMALEADGATVIRLLGMPEVVSIQADHPVSFIDKPGGVKTYGAPSK